MMVPEKKSTDLQVVKPEEKSMIMPENKSTNL